MTKDNFLDRKSYLDILHKRVNALKDGYRQNIAVIGDESVGKTSIIFKFLKTHQDNYIIPLYLEIRPESRTSFVNRFIGVLLYNFLSNSGLPLKEDIDYLVRRSEKYIPKTTEKIKAILEAVNKRKTNGVFAELLLLCDIINQETGKFCVLIFDEFHNLESLGFKDLYRQWPKMLVSHKNILFILVSSAKFKSQQILSKQLSLLFGNFEVLTVEPFDIKSADKYLQERFKGTQLNRGHRDFLAHFTGGFPMYMNVVCDAILKTDNPNLADTLQGLLFDSSSVLYQRFSNYIRRFTDSGHGNDSISILYLVASGRNKIKEIAHILRITKKELMPKIDRLIELDAVSRNADFLKINDRVFGFWVKFVYQEKMHSLTFDERNQKTLFRGSIEGMIQEFMFNAQKPIITRMTEILNLFENEMVQFGRKKVRLNHFQEIKPLEFGNRNLRHGLIGRSNDSLWIIGFKKDALSEEDIVEFSRECKKYRHKLQRKVIITLEGIDTNTRLRALEEKIWTWDLNYVNQILDLFSKPRVVA
ncbi:MAG: ATP-binding protein [Candidatus Omnitrophica bacterium]|nr:ATP-binding protein [Candidatus Omnitrophota bacterium]